MIFSYINGKSLPICSVDTKYTPAISFECCIHDAIDETMFVIIYMYISLLHVTNIRSFCTHNVFMMFDVVLLWHAMTTHCVIMP